MDFDTLLKKATQMTKQKVAIAVAEDFEVLEAVESALDMGMAEFHLYGEREKINQLIVKKPKLVGHSGITVTNAGSEAEAAELAVKAVRSQKATILMKGNVPTATLLKKVLNKEFGLRTGKVLSHIAVFKVPNFERLIIVTDSGMNITPKLEQKADIICNAVEVAHAIGIRMPRVAALAAVETLNPAMVATLDAAKLTEMNRLGQLTGCMIEGPLALDIAVSQFAAAQKGMKGEVAGKADILLVPTIEVGNVLYKSLTYFAGAQVGGVIGGAAAPIVLNSRSDSAESKLRSLALAICSAAE